MCALDSRGPGFLAPVAGAMREHRRQLDASVGASGPHDFAVRLTRHSSKAPRRPPHPAPNVDDVAQRPSSGTGRGELVEMICPTAKAKYFSREDWTGSISLIRFKKFAVRRTAERRESWPSSSLRANGSRECAPEDRLREAIHVAA